MKRKESILSGNITIGERGLRHCLRTESRNPLYFFGYMALTFQKLFDIFVNTIERR